jgi:uncharacterized SAM-binding protein YcdF (DUF218 family)
VRRAFHFLLALAGGLALVWLASLALVLFAGSRPVLRTADAIIVLGAAQYNGRPSPVLKARLDYALHLYERGFAPRLIVTGGVGSGDTVSEGEVARRYLLGAGVADTAIFAERTGTTSSESIAGAAALMRDQGLRTALIVSDSYHMVRLQLLARRAGIEAYRAPAPAGPIDRSAGVWRRYVLRESVIFPVTAVLGAF